MGYGEPPGNVRQAGSAADAVARKAAQLGIRLIGYQAEELARVALASFRDIVTSRQLAYREQWQAEGFREHLRQRMRYALLELVTDQGLLPVELPTERIRYLMGSIYDPSGPGREVPEEASWDCVAVTLEVRVRIPPVDRAAAVKAGVLTGPAS